MEIPSAATNLLLQAAPSLSQSESRVGAAAAPRQSRARRRRQSPSRDSQGDDALEPSHPHQPAQAQVHQTQAAETYNAPNPVKETPGQRLPAEGEGFTGRAEKSEVPRTLGSRLP